MNVWRTAGTAMRTLFVMIFMRPCRIRDSLYSATWCNIRLRPYIHLGVLFEWDFSCSRYEKFCIAHSFCASRFLFRLAVLKNLFKPQHHWGTAFYSSAPRKSPWTWTFLKAFKYGKLRVKHLRRALFEFHFHLQCSWLQHKIRHEHLFFWAGYTAFMMNQK